MHRFLAAFLGILAFLVVCLYWLWQIAAGHPALPLEDVALRALLAMLAVAALGWLLGRIGLALISESWHESRAREEVSSGRGVAFGGPGARQDGSRPAAGTAAGGAGASGPGTGTGAGARAAPGARAGPADGRSQ